MLFWERNDTGNSQENFNKPTTPMRNLIGINEVIHSQGNTNTVDLRSKGPGRKGNPLEKEMISSPMNDFRIHFYIGYKGFSVYRKN